MRKLWILAILGGMAFNGGASAQFSGNPVLELIQDGRLAKVVKQFSYKDPRGQTWVVPAGTIVDGASIPSPFWSFIGGPWDGNYRNASIIHDYYCDRKNRPWEAVHRVFYDGMVDGGVPIAKAKLMYFAVYRFGPRWQRLTTKVPGVGFDGQPRMVTKTITVDVPTPAYDPVEVEAAQKALAESDLSLEQIEAIADTGGGATD